MTRFPLILRANLTRKVTTLSRCLTLIRNRKQSTSRSPTHRNIRSLIITIQARKITIRCRSLRKMTSILRTRRLHTRTILFTSLAILRILLLVIYPCRNIFRSLLLYISAQATRRILTLLIISRSCLEVAKLS